MINDENPEAERRKTDEYEAMLSKGLPQRYFWCWECGAHTVRFRGDLCTACQLDSGLQYSDEELDQLDPVEPDEDDDNW